MTKTCLDQLYTECVVLYNLFLHTNNSVVLYHSIILLLYYSITLIYYNDGILYDSTVKTTTHIVFILATVEK